VDDPEHEQNAVLGHEVVHDAVIADAQAVERVRLTADRLYLLAADPATRPGGGGELLESCANPLPLGRWELQVGALGRGRETYLVGVAQSSSSSGVERPRR